MKAVIRGALAATFLSAVSVPALAADLPSIKAPPPPPVVDTFQPFQVRLELSGLVMTAGAGTAYDEGALAPFANGPAAALLGPYALNPLLATGLSSGPGTVIPWASTSTSYIIVPTLAVDYYINKNWSIEAICCVAPAHIQGIGSIKSTFAHTWVFPPSLLVDYHFTNFGAWQPYLGVGVNFTDYFGTRVNNESWPVFFQPSGPLTATFAGLGVPGAIAQFYNATVTPSWGVVGQAGLDYMFNEHWGLNLDVKYIMMEPTVHTKVAALLPPGSIGVVTALAGPLYIPVRVALPLDPLVISAGLTYRFGGGAAAPVLAKY
ncbi:MAG TPA: OmpW family outer membrane protein [Roseiarcus sp.]|nr:OmpW family outer membrane protein [Roseiarcus sp.]